MAVAMVLSGRRLPLVGGKSDFMNDPSDLAGDSSLADAIREFASVVDLQALRGSLDEELVTVISEAFAGDELEALQLLGEIATLLAQGQTPRQVAGSFMQELPETTASRAAIILAARRSFAAECADPRKSVICSERAWVHTALRDAGQRRLTEGELATHGITSDSPRSVASRGQRISPERTTASRAVAHHANRTTIIAAAKRGFAEECADPSKRVICSEQAWVNTALRDAKQKRLTDGEVARLGIAESSNPAPVSAAARGRPVTPTQSADRASIVEDAKRSYATECADRKKAVICSELAWVNTALRDAGQRRLTEDEIATRGVAE